MRLQQIATPTSNRPTSLRHTYASNTKNPLTGRNALTWFSLKPGLALLERFVMWPKIWPKLPFTAFQSSDLCDYFFIFILFFATSLSITRGTCSALYFYLFFFVIITYNNRRLRSHSISNHRFVSLNALYIVHPASMNLQVTFAAICIS